MGKIICGIYKITNIINNRFYVGKSVNIYERWKEHIRDSLCSEEKWNANKRGEQTPLHKAIRKYGPEAFTLKIIEQCTEEKLNEREKYWIKFFDAFESKYGYNCTLGGDGYSCGGGEKAPSSILTQKEVDIIKQLLKKGYTAKQIQEYVPKASNTTISNINNGHSWIDKNQTYPISRDNGHRKFDNDTVLKIRQKYCQGESIKQLSNEYNVAESTISSLVKGKTYTEVPVLYRDKHYHNRNSNRVWTDKEVLFFRHEYNDGKSILSLYNTYAKEKSCYAAFYNMIKGITYKNIGDTNEL